MNTTTKLLAAGLAAGFLAVGFLAANGAATAADMSAIDKRQDLMKNVVLKNFKTVKDFVETMKGSPADVKKAADELAQAAPKIAPLFVKGTGRPDVDPKKTRAEAKIWQDWAGFEAAAKAMGDEAAKLAEIAAKGDDKAIEAQFKVLGAKGCGTCHKPFRGEEVK
jgi:cytochrome c556